MSSLPELRERLRQVIVGTCNTVGCRDCDLKNDFDGKDGCAATDLQNKVLDAEAEEMAVLVIPS